LRSREVEELRSPGLRSSGLRGREEEELRNRKVEELRDRGASVRLLDLRLLDSLTPRLLDSP
jgi:hypothetical protein